MWVCITYFKHVLVQSPHSLSSKLFSLNASLKKFRGVYQDLNSQSTNASNKFKFWLTLVENFVFTSQSFKIVFQYALPIPKFFLLHIYHELRIVFLAKCTIKF